MFCLINKTSLRSLIKYILDVSKEELIEFRPELRDLFAEMNPSLEKSTLKTRVRAQLDCWLYTDSLRETVSQINLRLMPFDPMSGMRNWRISMIGDRFVLNRFAQSHI